MPAVGHNSSNQLARCECKAIFGHAVAGAAKGRSMFPIDSQTMGISAECSEHLGRWLRNFITRTLQPYLLSGVLAQLLIRRPLISDQNMVQVGYPRQ